MASEPTVYEVGGNSKFEIYHYSGEHLTKGAGQSLSKIRMEEEEAQHLVAHGTSHCRMFVSGCKFTLEEHPRKDMNTDYVLTEIQHTAVTDAFPSTEVAEGESYSNAFTCIPLSVPFRPLRVTRRPKINSLQPAIVIGPSGEEISTDQFGRVQVMFPWDADTRGTGTAWCRVSQVWAGNNWGAMFLPRIGQEVLVDFMEGKPDLPVIVGRVYNAEQMPPWSLPDRQNLSGFRSHSTKGGGEHNANVLTFDDTMGSEIFYMRAEKDMARRVENDDDLDVFNDQTITIARNRTESVLAGNETINIKQGNRAVTVSQGNDSLTVSMGSQTTEAMQSITLKVGPSSIVLTPTGVTIKGPMIDIEADGILTLKGGVTMIN
jgi:type VI secretion system secreted protein VgrG